MYSIMKVFLYRCRCSKLFWISIVAAFISGILFGLSTSGLSLEDKGSFDDMFIVPIFVIECIFLSLMIGREYSDGTIRNQLIAGKRRRDIFGANVGIAFFTTSIFVILFVIGFSVTAYGSTIRYLSLEVQMKALFSFLFVNYAWMAIFLCVSLLIPSREIGVLMNLVLIIVIMFSSYQLENLLGQPEFMIQESVIETVELTPEEIRQVHDGTFSGNYWYEVNSDETLTYYKDIMKEEEIPNPRALGAVTKSIVTHIDYFMPYGQVNMYVSFLTAYLYSPSPDHVLQEYQDVNTFPIYSVLLIIAVILSGSIFFERKNIK